MPAFSHLPGTIAPEQFEGRAEWVQPGAGVLSRVAVRLGSETSAAKLALAALAPLRDWLAGDTWEAILEELPFGLRETLRDAEAHLGPIPRLETADGYLRFVAQHVQHPPERAGLYASALLGAVASSLPEGLREAATGELPPELRALWLAAR